MLILSHDRMIELTLNVDRETYTYRERHTHIHRGRKILEGQRDRNIDRHKDRQ